MNVGCTGPAPRLALAGMPWKQTEALLVMSMQKHPMRFMSLSQDTSRRSRQHLHSLLGVASSEVGKAPHERHRSSARLLSCKIRKRSIQLGRA